MHSSSTPLSNFNFTRSNILVTNLTCCLIACCFFLFAGYWPFDLIVCDIWQVADVMMCTSSIMHMCIISLDRYIGIRNPLKTRNKSRTVVGIKIAMVWLVSLTIASPIILLSVLDPKNVLDNYTCAIFNDYFLIYGSLAAFFIPLSIMLCAYSLTIHRLNKQAQKCAANSKNGAPVMRRSMSKRKRSPKSLAVHQFAIQANGANGHGLTTARHKIRQIQTHLDRNKAHPSETEPLHMNKTEIDNTSTMDSLREVLPQKSPRASPALSLKGKPGQPSLQSLVKKHSAAIKVAGYLVQRCNEKKEMYTVKTERKAVKVLGTMFAIFVICWGPFFSANLAMGICDSCQIDDNLFKIFLWLGYTSSILNPIIYTVFNRTFKLTFIRILTCNRSCHVCSWARRLLRCSCLKRDKNDVQRNGTAIRIRVDSPQTAQTYDESLV